MVEIKFELEQNRAIAIENDNIIGQCVYIENDNTWNIITTKVSDLYQGQGIARKLVDCVIDKALENNLKVIADCSYADKILEKRNLK